VTEDEVPEFGAPFILVLFSSEKSRVMSLFAERPVETRSRPCTSLEAPHDPFFHNSAKFIVGPLYFFVLVFPNSIHLVQAELAGVDLTPFVVYSSAAQQRFSYARVVVTQVGDTWCIGTSIYVGLSILE
jgi:hypothetical protein